MKSLFLLVLLAFVQPSFAEDAESGEQAGEQALRANIPAPQPKAGDIFGELQFRPSVGYGNGDVKSENLANLGVRLGPDVTLDYLQYFNANLLVTGPASAFVGDDGFLRTRFNNVWRNVKGDLSLGFESRLYFPTNPAKRSAGYVAALRNIITVTKTFGQAFALTLQEIPILYGYDRAGNPNDKGGSANPIFDNRVYLIGTFNLSPKVTFELPLMLFMIKNRPYASTAANNDSWMVDLMIWPELMVQVGSKTWLGAAYYSDFLFADLGKGLAAGTASFVFRQTL